MGRLPLASADLPERLPHGRLEPDAGPPARHRDVAAAQRRSRGLEKARLEAVVRAMSEAVSSHARTLWQAGIQCNQPENFSIVDNSGLRRSQCDRPLSQDIRVVS